MNQKGVIKTSNQTYPPFLRWGNYTSENQKKPDNLKVEVTEEETFETMYGVNINAIVDEKEVAIPLHSFNSKNTKLLQLWTENAKKGKIKSGVKFVLYTWLRPSKHNKERNVRDWRMEF